MRLVVSRISQGPALSENLSGGISGLDLSSFGISGGSPGETTYFSLYLRAVPTDVEKELFDFVENISMWVDKNNTYTGDRTNEEDLLDILDLDDNSYGLTLKNPATGNYDILFTSPEYYLNEKVLLKASQAIYVNKEDISNPVTITNTGIDSAVVSSSSTGRNLIITTAQFTSSMAGLRIYNKTDSTSAVISEVVNSTEVILATTINDTWDGDSIYIKRLGLAVDGVLAISTNCAEEYGNEYKLDFQFKVPINYSRQGIKQFSLQFAFGSENLMS